MSQNMFNLTILDKLKKSDQIFLKEVKQCYK